MPCTGLEQLVEGRAAIGRNRILLELGTDGGGALGEVGALPELAADVAGTPDQQVDGGAADGNRLAGRAGGAAFAQGPVALGNAGTVQLRLGNLQVAPAQRGQAPQTLFATQIGWHKLGRFHARAELFGMPCQMLGQHDELAVLLFDQLAPLHPLGAVEHRQHGSKARRRLAHDGRPDDAFCIALQLIQQAGASTHEARSVISSGQRSASS